MPKTQPPLVPSPCVGLCSTTYGDKICRGCTRFMYEIVQWNQYNSCEKDAVWTRINSAVTQVLSPQILSIDKIKLKEILTRKKIRAYCPTNSNSPTNNDNPTNSHSIAQDTPANDYALVWAIIRFEAKKTFLHEKTLQELGLPVSWHPNIQNSRLLDFFYQTQENLILLASVYYERYLTLPESVKH
jgi:predicted Fe-S protein YdhL (DUF1289 family)